MKTYQIRKTILKALAEYHGTPCLASEVIEHPGFSLLKPSLSEVEAEWKQLESFGYIKACTGFDGRYCQITEKGYEQVNPEFAKTAFIHGPRYA